MLVIGLTSGEICRWFSTCNVLMFNILMTPWMAHHSLPWTLSNFVTGLVAEPRVIVVGVTVFQPPGNVFEVDFVTLNFIVDRMGNWNWSELLLNCFGWYLKVCYDSCFHNVESTFIEVSVFLTQMNEWKKIQCLLTLMPIIHNNITIGQWNKDPII